MESVGGNSRAQFYALRYGHHYATLAVTSFPERTSPVKRGVWVLEQVLGRDVPPPPPNVPALDKQDQQKHLTLRRRGPWSLNSLTSREEDNGTPEKDDRRPCQTEGPGPAPPVPGAGRQRDRQRLGRHRRATRGSTKR